ncbi:IFRD1 regulator, partial [Polypterus senegalus]
MVESAGATCSSLSLRIVETALTSPPGIRYRLPGSEPVDEQTAAEETEDKLKQCIDNLMDKSLKTRLAALESLKLAFSSKMLCDFLLERRLTLTVCLERCLRKGSGEEQALTAQVATLLCIQLGSGAEAEDVLKALQPFMFSILIDTSASPTARQSCALALAMCCYVAATGDMEDLSKCLSHLEGVFSNSYPCRDGSLPTLKASDQVLHCTALQSWALLITLCSASYINTLLEEHLPKLQACLSSSDVHFRIAVGGTIALLFELAREIDQDFVYEDVDNLCDHLKDLATDSNKYRAKTDRRKQRSIFREVLHYIESEDFTEEKIQFGMEAVYIDCWVRRRIYDAFKEVLGSGVRHHLQLNHLLREIFELGPPLVHDAVSIKANKISRFEKEDPSADGFMRISDQAMTEIELHSVESINDLHRLNNNLEPTKTVRQNESIHALSFAIKQRKELVKELSALTKELQELRHNLTADWSLHGT